MKSVVTTIIVIVIVLFVGIASFNPDKSEDNEKETTSEIISVENLEEPSKNIYETATAEIVTTVEPTITQSQTTEESMTEQSTSRVTEVQTSQTETTTAQPQEQPTTPKQEQTTTAPKQEETTTVKQEGNKVIINGIEFELGDDIEEGTMSTEDYELPTGNVIGN